MSDKLEQESPDDLVLMSFLISRAERRALRVKAAKEGITMTKVVRTAIRELCDLPEKD